MMLSSLDMVVRMKMGLRVARLGEMVCGAAKMENGDVEWER